MESTVYSLKYTVYSHIQWVVRKGRNHVSTGPMDLRTGLQNWKRFVNQTKTAEETTIFSCSPLVCVFEVLLWAELLLLLLWGPKDDKAQFCFEPVVSLLTTVIYTFFQCFLFFGLPFGRDNLHTSLYFYTKCSLVRSFASSSNKSFSVEFLGHFKAFRSPYWLKVKGRMFNWVSHGQNPQCDMESVTSLF